jgi:large subunit ribosomal protein L10
VLLTEYRGIDVDGLATLRRSLREAGGEYKVFKNTLVRIATRELGHDLDEFLVGPTAIAFVPDVDGADPALVAKALKTFGKDNPNLVLKGGLLGDRVLSAADTNALAEVAPREVLLARLAGGLAAPMQKFASLLQALPRNFAYGLAALIEQGGAPGAPAPAPAAEEPTAAEEAPVAEEVPAASDAADGPGDDTIDAAAEAAATTDDGGDDAAADTGSEAATAEDGTDTPSAEAGEQEPEQES